MASYQQTLHEQNAAPAALRDRFARIGRTWGESVISFCLLYMFFLGLLFTCEPLFHTIPKETGWGLWGVTSLVFFGLIFMALSLYGALFPERGGGVLATIVMAGLGLVTAIVIQFSPIGILFWALAAAGAIVETIHRVRQTGTP